MKFEYPPGATPIDDISCLKKSWVRNQAELNQVEAENINKAIGSYLLKPVRPPITWFEVDFLRKAHKAMFGQVWEWAGDFRRTATQPGVAHHRISLELRSLCADIKYWNSKAVELTPLEQAAHIHHRLVYIHPFPNGNGRFSRLMADRYLKSLHCSFPRWPAEMGSKGDSRQRYIDSLKKADRGDTEALILYMRDYGAEDPSIGQVLALPFFKQHFRGARLESLVKALLRREPNPPKTYRERKPLNLAIEQELDSIVMLLLESGADFREKDRSGLDAFEYALSRSRYAVAHEMTKLGYPYVPRHPSLSLKVPHENLYSFDMIYF